MNVLIRERRKKVVNKDLIFAERYIWNYFKTLLEEANFKAHEGKPLAIGRKSLNASCEGLALKASLGFDEIEVMDCFTYIIELEAELNFNDRITHIYGRFNGGDFSKFFQEYGNALLDCSRSSLEDASIDYFDKQDESWSLKVCRG